MTKEEATKKGYVYYCLNCNQVYKEIPQVEYEDGHGGRLIDCCKRCGCDLFARVADDKPAERA